MGTDSTNSALTTGFVAKLGQAEFTETTLDVDQVTVEVMVMDQVGPAFMDKSVNLGANQEDTIAGAKTNVGARMADPFESCASISGYGTVEHALI